MDFFGFLTDKDRGRRSKRDEEEKVGEGVCFDAELCTWEPAKEAGFGKPV